MTTITLDNITKRYGSAPPAVNDISLRIEAGTLTVLLGPSGCGKSTTLRMIAGLDHPSSGRIRIGERDVTELPPSQRQISMVFQSYALFPHLSVRENILFGLKVRKEPKAQFGPRLAKVAALLGLEQLLDRKPAQLSGGQQQRVALGRAVISEAPICLMDEPLSNLDAQLRHEMRREIRALQQKLGITMVYVTHDQTEAMSMADRVVLLNGGNIVQNDTPDRLYGRPSSEFSARFIGTPPMNLIKLNPQTRQLLARHGHPEAAEHAGAQTLGIRPEHLRLSDEHGLPATVESVEYFGADSIVICSLGGNTGIAVREAGHMHAAAGATVQLQWSADRQHFFDATGNALT
ncbi:ABC transporter ATP-binding protein [Parapusillimonas granuli]|uniref:ABC transporter ATP-binding protein n=1 Tax=Parapusillimonas granuli TaxID=380911 RepID=A0A853FVR3_9BURK|nr:ABC transporter ATP-binding protein [Parapusillimonas granuli]MBB5216485.1 sn-glycerol 3-phosphate transport system ATP-binding protein [Parapusillimonas granuli]MEB2399772.1 ABC transporter ATP-binding protein [Alcaligenaceae bacterium]NYT48209.1 ABC transporter ATP-binding protein [Parapusillimonas granuli]